MTACGFFDLIISQTVAGPLWLTFLKAQVAQDADDLMGAADAPLRRTFQDKEEQDMEDATGAFAMESAAIILPRRRAKLGLSTPRTLHRFEARMPAPRRKIVLEPLPPVAARRTKSESSEEDEDCGRATFQETEDADDSTFLDRVASLQPVTPSAPKPSHLILRHPRFSARSA